MDPRQGDISEAAGLLDRYLHATLAVIDDAGHAIMQQPELFAALFVDWLDRTRPQDE